MADVTISSLPLGTPSNSAVLPYSEGGQTRRTTVSNFGVPVGAVFHLATSTVPVGYLKCNGDTVPNGNGTVQGITADFSVLYSVLSNTYGALGKLPDLRGEFIRGFDDGRGIDPSRAIGSNQADELKSHNHGYNTYLTTYAANLGSWFPAWYSTQSTTTTNTGGTETRPRNVALMAVIKY